MYYLITKQKCASSLLFLKLFCAFLILTGTVLTWHIPSFESELVGISQRYNAWQLKTKHSFKKDECKSSKVWQAFSTSDCLRKSETALAVTRSPIV